MGERERREPPFAYSAKDIATEYAYAAVGEMARGPVSVETFLVERKFNIAAQQAVMLASADVHMGKVGGREGGLTERLVHYMGQVAPDNRSVLAALLIMKDDPFLQKWTDEELRHLLTLTSDRDADAVEENDFLRRNSHVGTSEFAEERPEGVQTKLDQLKRLHDRLTERVSSRSVHRGK